MRIGFKDATGQYQEFQGVSSVHMGADAEDQKLETGNQKRPLRDLPLVGLCGRAGAGKDTLFQVMREHLPYRDPRWSARFERLAFADALKQVALILAGRGAAEAIFPRTKIDKNAPSPFSFEDLSKWSVDVAVDVRVGVMSWREYLQVLGTEVMRESFVDDVWLRVVKTKIEANPQAAYVVTDCRFPNELQLIRDLGGVVWRIERPDLGADADGHTSEHAWRDFKPDAVIQNNRLGAGYERYLADTARLMLAEAWPNYFK